MKSRNKIQSQKNKKIAIIGTGGFASGDVLYICHDVGYKKIVFVDPVNEETCNKDICGYPLLGGNQIPILKSENYDFIVAIGDNKYRQTFFCKHNKLKYTNIIHPTSSMGFIQAQSINKTIGNIVAAGARFANNIEFGNFGIYNFNCTVGHDCILRDFINISPGVNVSGKVIIEEGAFIGTNAAVREGHTIENRLRIGSYAVVGANAFVLKDIPPNKTAVGIPAKIME